MCGKDKYGSAPIFKYVREGGNAQFWMLWFSIWYEIINSQNWGDLERHQVKKSPGNSLVFRLQKIECYIVYCYGIWKLIICDNMN